MDDVIDVTARDVPDTALVVSPHPLTVQGQRLLDVRQAPLLPGETLALFLARHGVPQGQQWAVTLGGVDVPERLWHCVRPRHGHLIEARRVPGKQVLQIVAILVLAYFTAGIASGALAGTLGTSFAAGTIGASLAASAVFMAGSMVINKLLGPKAVSSSSNAVAAASPTYAISGGRNRSRQFEPMALVLGEPYALPDLSAQPYVYFAGEDQYLWQVMHCGINCATVQSVRIGETDFAAYADAELFRDGMSEGNTGMPALVSSVDSVGGGLLDAPASPGAWVQRTTSAGTVQIVLDIEAQLSSMTNKGDYQTNYLVLGVQTRRVGTQEWLPLTADGAIVLSNYGAKPVRKTFTFDVPEAQYDVRLRKETANSTLNTDQNVVTWTTLKSVQRDTANYAGQARLGVRIKASGQLSGAIDELNCMAIAKPMPVWDGSSWATATRRANGLSNPGAQILLLARGIRDDAGRLLAGLGMPDAQIDIEGLQGFMLHCTARGFTFDYFLQETTSIGDLLASIAAAGLGSISWHTGKLGVIWFDDSQPVEGVLNMTTMKAKSFSVDYDTLSTAEELEIQYFDRDRGNTWKSLRVLAPGVTVPSSTARQQLVGVTTEAHAAILMRFTMAQNVYQRKTVNCELDLEHLVFRRGSVIALSHDVTQWGYGGRVQAVASAAGVVTLTLDDLVPSTSPSGLASRYIGLRLPGERSYRVFGVQAFTGSTRTVTLASAWPAGVALPGAASANPAHDTVWIYDFKATPGQKLRIADISPQGNMDGARLALVPESGEFWNYVWNAVYEPPPNNSLLAVDLPSVERLDVTAAKRRLGDGWEIELTATFEVVGNYGSVQLWAGADGNALAKIGGDLYGSRGSFVVVRGQTWAIEVRPFDPLGRAGRKAATTFHVAEAPPAAVTGLTVAVENDGVVLRWQLPASLDYVDWSVTQLREGATWDTGALVFEGRADSFSLGWITAGSHVYWAAHRNTAGDWSSPASATLDVVPPSQPVVQGEVQFDEVTLKWGDCKATQPLRHHLIRRGPVFATAESVGRPIEQRYVARQPVGTHFFWVVAVDLGGNMGTPGYVQLTVLPAIDEALAIIHEGLDELVDELSAESQIRLQSDLAEQTARALADGNLNQSILQEANTRAQNEVAAAQALAGEMQTRAQADAAAAQSLAAEAQTRSQAVNTLLQNLSDEQYARIAAINQAQADAVAGIAGAKAELNASIAAVGAQIADIVGASEYDTGTAYDLGDLVKYAGKLYRAVQGTVGNVPTNTTYWELVGDYASIGEAVAAHAAQLSNHETRITQNANGLTAEANDRNTLAAQLRGSYTGTDPSALTQGLAYQERVARVSGDSANASLIQGVDSRLQSAQGQIAGQGTAISGLLTSVDSMANTLAVQSQRIDTVTAFAGTRPNLLPNGGFERGGQGWQNTAGWAIGVTGYWGQVAMRTGYTGTGVLESEPFAASEGADYTITGDTLFLNATEGAVYFDLQFLGDAGVPLLDGPQNPISAAHDFSEGYAIRNQHAVTARAPAGSRAMVARFVYVNVQGTNTYIGCRQVKVERGVVPATAYSSEAGQSAEAAAVGTLTTRVTTAENSITVQSGRLTSLEARASTNEGQVAANSGAIGSLNSQVEIINGTIASQASDIVTLQASTQTRPNVVANGNFERGLEGMFSTSGWSVSEGSWGRTATATLNGTGSLDWPRFSVFRDQLYTAAADSLLFAASGAVALGLLFYDGAGAIAADRQGPSVAATHDFTASGANRRAHAFQTVVPANAVEASVRFIYRDVVNCQVMGVRLVKVERGGLPATAYSSEAYDTASGAAMSALTTRVTNAEGSITSQSGQLVSLADRLGAAESTGSANSGAIGSLNSQVSSINGTLSAQAGQLTSLTGRIAAAEGTGSANSGAIQSLDLRMSSAEGAISSQSAAITWLDNRLTGAEGAGSANSGAIQSLNSQVSSINGTLSSQAGQLVSLTARVGNAETNINNQGTAISGLDTRVSQLNGTVDVQTSSITRLQAIVGTRPNLLPNGGFERGAQGWPGSAGWSIGASGYWGQVAMRSGVAGTGVLESDPFPISEGAPYVITADTLLLGATAGGVFVDMQFRANDGTVLLDGDQRIITAAHDFSASYGTRDQHAVAAMAPSGAVKATARFVYYEVGGANVLVGVRQIKVERGDLPATAYSSEAGQSAESSAVGVLTARVTSTEGSISSQSGQIVSLADRLTAAEGTGSANSGAIQSLSSQVSSINGTLSSQAGQLVSLTARVGNAETNINNQGTAIAGLDTQVSQLGGTVAVQTSDITSLKASTTTRPNLLVNGNFENGLTGIGNASAWFVDDGSWGRSARSGAVSGTDAIDWPVLPVFEGAPYTMAADTLLFAAAGSVRLGVIFYTETGTQLADLQGPSRYANHDFAADGSGRNLIAFGMQAPAGATKAVPRLIYDSIAGLQVIGVRLVKFERGGLPATRYSAERQDSSTGSALQSLTTRLNVAEGSITSQSGAITSLENRIGGAEGSIAAQSGAIQSLSSQVSSINGTLSSQAGQLVSLTARVGNAETNINNQGTAIAGLDTQVSQLNGSVAVQSQQISNLRARVGSRPNEIPNGGFERGLAGMSQVQPGWQIEDGIWGRTAIHRGVYGTGTLDWPAIPVQEYAVYTMTGDSLLFAGSGVCRFGLLFYTAGNVLLSDSQGPSVAANHDFSVDDSNRLAHAFAAQAPAGANYAVPRFIYEGVDGITVIGCRMVKAERGGLPSTPYSAEALLSAEAGALQSLTVRVTNTEGTVNNQAAAITWLEGRITGAEGTGSANSGAISSLNTQVSSINGTLSSQSGQLTSLSDRLTNAEGTGSANSGAIQSLGSRVSSAEGSITAQAQSLSLLTASVSGNSASISTQAQALADLTGSVRATWRLNVDANGKTGGIILDNNGQVISLVMVLDKFAIAQQVGSETKYPFAIGLIDGVSSVGIAGNMYIDGTIKARMLDVERLSAITSRLGIIYTGRIDIYHDGEDGEGDGYVRSAGYTFRNGTNGWIFGRNGDGTSYLSFKGGPCELWMHSSGDAGWISPGISMTNAGLSIWQIDVMGTLQLRGNSVSVPVSSAAGSQIAASGGWQDALDCYVSMPYAGVLYANFSAIQGFPAGTSAFAVRILVDGSEWFSTGIIGPALQPLISAAVSNPIGAGVHRVLVQWIGDAGRSMQLGSRTLFAQGTMR